MWRCREIHEMNDDIHLSISVSEFCYCVRLIIVMALKLKSYFLLQWNLNHQN